MFGRWKRYDASKKYRIKEIRIAHGERHYIHFEVFYNLRLKFTKIEELSFSSD